VAHGGQIEYVVGEGRGAAFRLTLPLDSKADAVEEVLSDVP
jgi:signal transduction histidine kinase